MGGEGRVCVGGGEGACVCWEVRGRVWGGEGACVYMYVIHSLVFV